jgi:alkylhydroperoxidase/carboxymuconolactone decarboxylase family protein
MYSAAAERRMFLRRRHILNPPDLSDKATNGDPMDTYYDPTDLGKFSEIGKDAPELAGKFFDYYGAVFAEGELTEREKALIALAVAHTVQCPYCIDAYTRACLEKGSNLGEMTEAVHVVTAIRGGASLVHGLQMRKIAEKLSL